MQSPHDDAPQRTGLAPPNGRAVRFDDQAAVAIDEGQIGRGESVHRDGDDDMLQERLKSWGLGRVVQPRGERARELRRMHNPVVGRPGLLGGPLGYLLRTPVL